MRALWSKLRRFAAGRRSLADDLEAEISAHLEFEIDERVARGMPPDEARASARCHVGNLTGIAERARDTWTFPPLESFALDVRYGLRGIRRSPGFALVVVATLALGIGATTAIFSVVNTVLLRPLPYPAAERLVGLSESDPRAEGISVTWLNYQHWRNENHSFEDMAGFRTVQLTLTGRGDPALTRAGLVTCGFFGLLGAHPLLGRTFSEPEDQPGAAPTVVLDSRFWASKLGADPGILGAALALDGTPYTVIGVMPPELRFFGRGIDYYLPLHRFEGAVTDRSRHGSMRLLARLKPQVTLSAAITDLDGIMRRLAESDPGPESQHRAHGVFLTEAMTGDTRPALLVLLAAAALVLMIACANVASVVLARATARGREIAIRAAIGAGRRRLVRQLLTESLLLAAIGGAAGSLLAQWGSRTLAAMGPRAIPRLAETSFDARVLLFALAVTVLTGLFTGIAPALAAGRLDLVSALKNSSRAAAGRAGHRSRGMLVAAEVALTLVLAFAAGMLLRNLIAAQTGDPGFLPEHLLALELMLPPASYRSPQAIAGFYDTLEQNLRTLPGVTAVGAVNCPPSGGDCGDWFYSVLDRPAPSPSEVPIALFNNADRDYFSTMHIPLREGRAFRDTGRPPAPLAAIVNETFARKWWPRQSAIGQRIKFGGPYRGGPVYEIAGVAGDVSQMGLGTEAYPEVYLPFSQSPDRSMVVMIRSAGDTAVLAPAVRGRVAALDRNLPVVSLEPFTRVLAASLSQRRFSTLLLALFAGLAMLLAAIGIYGLLNYWVRVREDEIAIRMALGAPPRSILGWTAWQALRLSLAGAAAGVMGSWAAARWLGSLLFGVAARDFATLAAAALVVVFTAVLATAIPAWHATRVDAAQQLHHS
ncbi:MAG TPA: ABC transporter permease [Bryobacteraceae bacterium]|nr:ABC transporter permease [Bryobacteraceae bacterium]